MINIWWELAMGPTLAQNELEPSPAVLTMVGNTSAEKT